jgi:hypothetical protein
MKKAVVLVMIAFFAAAACTGTFKLTRQVYDFQTKPADKWVDEVIFLAFVIVPVYGVSALVDAVVFNSIEFWTGKNPMEASLDNKDSGMVAQNGRDQVTTEFDVESKNTEMTSASTGQIFVIARTDAGVAAKDREGKVLFTSVEDSRGGVTVSDGNGLLIRHFSPEEVQEGRAEFLAR